MGHNLRYSEGSDQHCLTLPFSYMGSNGDGDGGGGHVSLDTIMPEPSSESPYTHHSTINDGRIPRKRKNTHHVNSLHPMPFHPSREWENSTIRQGGSGSGLGSGSGSSIPQAPSDFYPNLALSSSMNPPLSAPNGTSERSVRTRTLALQQENGYPQQCAPPEMSGRRLLPSQNPPQVWPIPRNSSSTTMPARPQNEPDSRPIDFVPMYHPIAVPSNMPQPSQSTNASFILAPLRPLVVPPPHVSMMNSSSNVYTNIYNVPMIPQPLMGLPTHRPHLGPQQEGRSLPNGTVILGPQTSRTFFPSPSSHVQFYRGARNEAIPILSARNFPGTPLQQGPRNLTPAGYNRYQNVNEESAVLSRSLVIGIVDMHDQHSDMRLDVDNMSYEELLALEERIGNVNTGIAREAMASCFKTMQFPFGKGDAPEAVEIKCSICQEDYVEGDEVGMLNCNHIYHTGCVKQWLALKNQCPICKAAVCLES